MIAVKLPEFLLHPYGPLTKNLPMLAAIALCGVLALVLSRVVARLPEVQAPA